MSHETGQLDSVDRQLLETGAPPKASEWTEIGEAEIVYTIFGKAKVRIIRKHDKMRSGLFLLVMLVIVVVAWQGWVLYERSESMQNVDILPEKNSKSDVTAPAAGAENSNESSTAQLLTSKKSESQQPNDLNDAKPLAVKPIVHQPLRAIRPQSAPVATNNGVLMNQADKPLQVQPSPKANVAPPAVTLHASQTPASGSAVATPLVAPLNKAEVPNSTSANEGQLADPINPKH
jgi:cytoskeletal protein RodZ